MDIVYAIVTGILFSVLVFGVKTGAGCGFSSIGRRKVLLLGFSYFLISVLMGALTGYIDMSGLESIAGMGMAVHSVLALLLIGAGIYTSKKWNCGCDVSKHTFLFLSLPCPVCLAALFLSCMVLATTLEVGGLWIGVLVGLVFFLAVICSSYLFRKMGKKPDTLGGIMLFLGVFYLMGVLLIPAFIKTQSMYVAPLEAGTQFAFPLVVITLFIFGGFIFSRMRGQ